MRASLHAARGFTYLELVIVIIIISTLLYVAIDRLLRLEVEAERASMQQVIGILQSALAMAMAEQIAKGDIPAMKKYINTNPMNLLAQQPENYLGAHRAEPDPLPTGSWYFLTSSKSLIYRVRNQEYFATASNRHDGVELKILPVYDDNNRNGRFDAGDTLKGLRLQPLEAYHWLSEPLDPQQIQREQTQQQKVMR
jgi:type II secretory pathway pseudopilin PulG